MNNKRELWVVEEFFPELGLSSDGDWLPYSNAFLTRDEAREEARKARKTLAEKVRVRCYIPYEGRRG